MVCGGNSWKLLYQIYSVIEHTKDVEVFVYEEDVNTQLMIIDAIELIYSDKGENNIRNQTLGFT